VIGTLAALGGLFTASLVAATLLPAQSEGVLVALIFAGKQNPWLLVGVATVGNTLGSLVNWILGRGIERFRDKRWFPVKASAMDRAERFYQRFGKWSLLLSWAPVIGDPLTLVAGVLREPLLPFLVIVGFAKAARYVVLALVTLGWLGTR
jgi:membrane protein YqaA with SNARE-associated domain